MPTDLISPEGKLTTVSDDQVPALLQAQFKVASPDVKAEQIVGDAAKANISSLESAGQAAGNTATLGATGALQRALGGPVAATHMRLAAEAHPTASLLGTVGTALLDPLGTLGAVGKLGGAVSDLAGGGIVAHALGGAVEGGIYGVGSGVSDLAQSQDPLTAEHIASTLSTQGLLGAGIGGITGGLFKAGERVLSRAGEAITDATAAKSALGSVPKDLAGADMPTLRAAKTAEDKATRAAADAEAQSLEDARVPQRKDLAEQVKALHDDIAEKGIAKAVQGADVDAIDGIKQIRSQLADSFYGVRNATKSTDVLANNPSRVIDKLTERAQGLEALKAKTPELLATLGDDARAAGLDHVDDALTATRDQIAKLRAVDSKMNPVASDRLTELRSGVTPRGVQIQNAMDALKNAPEAGILQKSAQAAAFGGVTAVAHMIPGVGVAAPFLGAGASKLVGRVFEHLAGNGAAVAQRSQQAAQTFLAGASKVTAAAPMVASKVLSMAKFGQGPDAKSGSMVDQYHRVSAELRAQTMYAPDGSVQMRPDARQAMAARLAPIGAVNPSLADKIESNKAGIVAFVSSKLPRQPESGGIQIGPDTWRPSDLAIRSFARTLRAAEDPASVEESLATSGLVTPEAADAYRTCHPARFAAFQQMILSELPKLSKTLPMSKKIGLSVFTGVPLIPALQPNVLQVLQGNFAAEPGTAGGTQAPKPMPQFGALGTPKSIDKPTPSQQLGG